jgi:hypothetical protein
MAILNMKKVIKRMYVLLFVIYLSTSVGCNNATQENTLKDTVIKKPAAVVVAKPVNVDSIRFERKSFTYDSTKTYIYLTFDDGPQPGTKECLETCKKLGVKATFFMVGQHAKDLWGQQSVKAIHDAYPLALLANHSYTHASERYKYFYQHPEMAEQDFYKAQQSLNVPYKIVRLPGNSAWVRKGEMKTSGLVKAVCKKLDSTGYNVIGWDVEWSFTRGPSFPVQSPAKMASEVNYAAIPGHSHTTKHVVLLSHDRMFRTPAYTDSLNKFISLLKQNPNYVFETIDHYPNLKF